MNKIFLIIIFILILIIGITTRFYKLGQAPAGFYLDEAAQGYNAYSILHTGRDEFGMPFPIVFRSFIDFKTPVYVYLIVPLIPLFDLTPFTVRLPSFIFSILTFPILFLLIRKISPYKIAIPLSLLTILLLAISPWHVLFGRTNFECNVALFFLVSGIYTLYKGLDKPIWLLLSAAMFVIAVPAYHSQRIVAPLILLLLVLRFRKRLFSKRTKKYTILGFLFGLLISLPTLSIVFTPGFLARAAGLNIFNSPVGLINNYQGSLEWIINNQLFLSVWEFLSLYFSYFSPRNMFVLGDSGLRSSFPELGTFFIWQLPFYIYGIYLLFKNRELREIRFLTIALLLIAPIPASLTRDPYSTIRALPLVIPQLIIISLGIIGFWEKLSIFKRYLSKLKVGTVGVLLILVIYSIAKLYSSVIILNEQYRGFYWDYGWEEVVKVMKKEFDPTLPVVVDNTRFEPYSQIAFFLKYPPEKYQKENYEVPLSEYYINMQRNRTKRIGNINTRAISWKEDLLIKQYLIGDGLAISEQQIKEHKLKLIHEVFYPDGTIAYRIVETK